MFAKLAQRPTAVFMFWSAFALLGLLSSSRMAVNLAPDRSYPGLSIRSDYSGVSPEKIEELITRPIEEGISTVGGVERLFSTSEEGRSTVDVQFKGDVDIDLAAMEIRERVDLAASGFPREAQKPQVLRYDPDKQPIFIVTLQSQSRNLRELRELADREIKKLLESEPGVSEVVVAGGREQEIIVACDKEKLDGYGVSLDEIVRQISASNLDLGLGRVAAGGGEYSLLAVARFRRPQSIADLPFAAAGRFFRLKDVAQVSLGERDANSASRLNGEERVSIYVHKTSHADLLGMTARMRHKLEELRDNDWHYEILYDQGATVREAAIRWALFSALLFLAWAFLQSVLRRDSFAYIETLLPPVVAFACVGLPLFLLGADYNIASATGLTLGAALAAAAAGSPPSRDLAGIARSGGLLLALGALAVAALILPDNELRSAYLPLARGFVLMLPLSLAVRLSLVPLIQHRRKRAGQISDEVIATPRDSLWRRPYAFLLRRLRRFARRLGRALQFRAAVAAVIVLLIPFLFVWFAVSIPKELYGAFDEKRLIASIEFPSGTSFAAVDSTSRKIEQKLSQAPGIVRISSRIEATKGSVRLDLDADTEADAPTIARFKELIGSTDPATVFFSTPEQSETLRQIKVDVFGEELEMLDKIVRALADNSRRISGVSEVILHYKPPRPERVLIVDREKIQRSGLTAENLANTVRLAVQGGVASRMLGARREYDIRVRYDEGFRRSLEALGGFGVKGQAAQLAPVLELTRMEDRQTPVRIYRIGKKRALSFSVQLGLANPDRVIAEIQTAIDGLALPPEYRADFSEEVGAAHTARRRAGWLLVCAILVLAPALAIAYESVLRGLREMAICVALATPLLGILWLLGRPLTAPLLFGLVAWLSVTIVAERPPRILGPKLSPARYRFWLVFGLSATPLSFAGGPGASLLSDMALPLAAGALVALFLRPALARMIDRGSAQILEWGAALWRELDAWRSKKRRMA